uniref:Ig-like domain-containing protein n=1 Tax=Hippocampus comes TaxID=109280 RepID=A0A3Q3E361_HIPCM
MTAAAPFKSQTPSPSRSLKVRAKATADAYCRRVSPCHLQNTRSHLLRPSEPPAVDFDVSVKNGVMIKAGESLKLPAVVTGRPQPEVKWAKDDAEIDKGRMIVETDGKHSSLFIKKALRKDHGKYQISGTNSSGTKMEQSLAITRFRHNGVMIKAGESLKLPAVVTGRPQPEVKWAKDDAEIDKGRMIVETDGKHSSLFIKKALRKDHGKYQISGTNSSGTKAAETKVDVMGQCHSFDGKCR